MPLRDLFDRKHIASELAVLAIAGVAGAIWALLSPGFRDFWSGAFHAIARSVFVALGWLFDHRHEIALLFIGALLSVVFLARALYRSGYRAGEIAERTRVNNERAREEALHNAMLGHEEQRVMEELGRADGRPLTIEYFEDKFGWGHLQTANVLTALMRRGLIDHYQNILSGECAILTDRGRAYVTVKGYIPRA